MRFQKRITIAPGIRINIGKKGASLSVGPRGASISIGQKGVYQNIGLPGTGISFRNKISSNNTFKSNCDDKSQLIDVKVSLLDDGTIKICDENDILLPPSLEKKVKKEKKVEINALLHSHMNKINQEYDGCINQYKLTPAPELDIIGSLNFNLSKPVKPVLYKTNIFTKVLLLDYFLKMKNKNLIEIYNQNSQEWLDTKTKYLEDRKKYLILVSSAESGDIKAMEELLCCFLDDINWNKETIISYDFSHIGKVKLDIDLPEIEDMPTKLAKRSKVGFKLLIKEKSQKEIKFIYYNCINSTIFRIIGEVFASLKNINEVDISGYTQRFNKKTGNLVDDYIISANVSRELWSNINISNIDYIDPCEALEQFNLRRKVNKSYYFNSITPF